MTRATQALVVGAGPVGLTAALALHSLGITAIVLEAEPEGRVRAGSRALFVHRDTLNLLERLSPGLGIALAQDGIVWRHRRTFYRGREVFACALPEPPQDQLPPFTSLRQVETERHLLEACQAVGVGFEWAAEIRDVMPSGGGVQVSAADGRTWSSPYLVAADGSRSVVRTRIGIALEGIRSKGFHVVIDVEEHHSSPPVRDRTFHYEHPELGGRNVLIVPFSGGFQVDLQCRETDVVEEFTAPDAARKWLARVVDARHLDHIRWISKYHFLQKVATRFTEQHRRVLLAGEAAHLFAPFGARGMNSGMADADAAAASIALALAATHRARAVAAVDAYDRERRVAAEFNRSAAGDAFAHMNPQGWWQHSRRRFAAALAPVVPACRNWLERAPYGPRGWALPTSRY